MNSRKNTLQTFEMFAALKTCTFKGVIFTSKKTILSKIIAAQKGAAKWSHLICSKILLWNLLRPTSALKLFQATLKNSDRFRPWLRQPGLVPGSHVVSLPFQEVDAKLLHYLLRAESQAAEARSFKVTKSHFLSFLVVPYPDSNPNQLMKSSFTCIGVNCQGFGGFFASWGVPSFWANLAEALGQNPAGMLVNRNVILKKQVVTFDLSLQIRKWRGPQTYFGCLISEPQLIMLLLLSFYVNIRACNLPSIV